MLSKSAKSSSDSMESGPTEIDIKMSLKKDELPEKEFVGRNSLLTDMFQDPNYRTIYNISIVGLLALFVSNLAEDLLGNGRSHYGFRLIEIGFSKLHLSVIGWIIMLQLVCLMAKGFTLWASITIKTSRKAHLDPSESSYPSRALNFFGLAVLISYYGGSLILTTYFVLYFEIRLMSAALLFLEQVRFIMKLHAFIRCKIREVKKLAEPPKFSNFSYFLFAPTLIYRDAYPRTEKISWSFVTCRILEIAATSYFYCLFMEALMVPYLEDFVANSEKITWKDLFLMVTKMFLGSWLVAASLFFLFFHSFQNLFAELLRFGDRLFYRDWWCSTSYNYWFRTSSSLVQDWLYEYIYKDVFRLTKSKVFAKVFLGIISVIAHEWLLVCMLGFFFPVLSGLLLTFGAVFTGFRWPRRPICNVIFIYTFGFGMSMISSMYGIEYLIREDLRLSSSNVSETWKDFFVPKILDRVNLRCC